MSINMTQAQQYGLASVLIVDQDQVIRTSLSDIVNALGYTALTAENDAQAIDLLTQHHDTIDAIILDLSASEIQILQLASYMKQQKTLRNIPIIMQTEADQIELIKQSIDFGVFYYFAKPIQADLIKPTLAAAVAKTKQHRLLAKELQKCNIGFTLMDICTLHLKTMEEVESASSILANCFPDPERAIGGIAELLINAIEHGNLGITYNEKTQLISDGTWKDEIDRRSGLPENKNKVVEVEFSRKDDGFYVKIKDQGGGFEWKNFLFINPSSVSDNHGRGIAWARAYSFDDLTYNDKGNEAIAYVSNKPVLEW